jgi:hypothetical protein
MKKKLLITGLVLFVLGVAGGVIGYVFVYNKPHRNIETAKPDFVVTADELLEQVVEAGDEADSRFVGKVIVVEGTISERREMQTGMIQLTIPGTMMADGKIMALMHKSFASGMTRNPEISAWTAGAHVSIICEFTGSDFSEMLGIPLASIELENCYPIPKK